MLPISLTLLSLLLRQKSFAELMSPLLIESAMLAVAYLMFGRLKKVGVQSEVLLSLIISEKFVYQ